MALQSKAIKSKIKTVTNVKKITKAMEKVAAVKMRQIVARTLAAREYAFHTYELLHSVLSHRHAMKHEFFNDYGGKKVLIVAISSNRGLAGNLNTQMSKAIIAFMETHPENEFEMIAVGKKMEKLAMRLGIKLVASFTEIPEAVHARDILAIVELIKKEFQGKGYKKIVSAYSHYASALSFTPVVRQILPLKKLEIENVLKTLFKSRAKPNGHKLYQYTFEPSEGEVLDFVLPKILEVKLYKMLLESRACEQSARMMAMKKATDNAEELIKDLFVSYNRARQDGITREISEVVAGAGGR
jgi:F-type H+-transporting ATPase subunit gamma